MRNRKRKQQRTANLFRGLIVEGFGALLFLMLVAAMLPAWTADSAPVSQPEASGSTVQKMQQETQPAQADDNERVSQANVARPPSRVRDVSHQQAGPRFYRGVQQAYHTQAPRVSNGNARHAVYYQPIGAVPVMYDAPGSQVSCEALGSARPGAGSARRPGALRPTYPNRAVQASALTNSRGWFR